jgi:hypothetical protein
MILLFTGGTVLDGRHHEAQTRYRLGLSPIVELSQAQLQQAEADPIDQSGSG